MGLLNIENVFFTSLFWFFLAIVFAAVEIEVEGKYGWAEKMPTWFRAKGLPAKLYGLFLFMFFLPILIFHSHFVMGVSWSVEAELLVFALYFVWMPTWDFLWFALNPYYGVRKFKKQAVWWHAKSHWLFDITPLDYIFGWGLSTILAGIAAWLASDAALLFVHLYLMIWFLFFTALVVFVAAPLYKRWHVAMRRRDDRLASGIFHGK